MEKRKTGERNVLWTLFTSMLYISAFTFGGGFVIVTFMKKKCVDDLHWINEDEMLDMTALAQSAPGAIAVHAAILVGRRVAGFTGMIVSVLGTIVPPITILAVISLFYKAFATNPWVAAVLGGMQAGVAAVICDVVWNLGAKVVKEKSAMSIAIMAGAFIATAFFKVNVIVIILCAAALGVIRLLVERGKAGGK